MARAKGLFPDFPGRFFMALVCLTSAAVFLTSTADDGWAQSRRNPQKAVAKRDRDGDGKVSPEEWDKSPVIFRRIDKDKDGFLSPEDFAKHWGMMGGGGAPKATGGGAPKTGGRPAQGGTAGNATAAAKAHLAASAEAMTAGRSLEALDAVRKAAAAIEGASVPGKLRQKVYAVLSKREYAAGNAFGALKAMRKALKASQSAALQAELVILYLDVGRLKAAEKEAVAARRLAQKVLNKRGLTEKQMLTVSHSLASMEAAFLEKQGRWREAEPKIREMGQLIDRLKAIDDRWRLRSLRSKWELARNLMRQGRIVEAEIAARGGLNQARAEVSGASVMVANLARFVGEAVLAQGRRDDARDMAEQAITLLSEAGEPPSSRVSVLAKRFMGTLLAQEGDWRAAEEQFAGAREALSGNKALASQIIDNYPIVIVNDIKQGRAEAALGRLEKRHRRMNERLGRKHQYTAVARALIGVARAEMGERDKALADFRDAVPYMLSRSRASDSDEDDSQSNVAVIRRVILETYMDVLTERYEKDGAALDGAPNDGKTPLAEAFRIADVARGSIVQKALAASGARAVAGQPDLAALVRTEQDARKSIGALNKLLADVLGRDESERDAEGVDELKREIDRLRDARGDAMAEIEKRFPDYARLIDPKPASIEDARSVLADGEALVVTYFGEDRGYAWSVGKDGGSAFTRIELGSEDVLDLVSVVRSALDPGTATIGEIPSFDVETAHELYAQVLGPLEGVWRGAKSLLLVAHGPLGALPLSVLPTAPAQLSGDQNLIFADHRNVPWLAKTHAVTLVPSVAALAALRRLPKAGAGRSPFVGFGDPFFAAEQAAAAVAETDPGATAMRGAVSLRSVYRGDKVAAGELAQLQRLPDTAPEVVSIARALETDPSKTVFLGREANEARVKSMDLSTFKVITFATHGLVPGDLEGLTQPALALTAPDVAGTEGDGLLTMEEILGLKLDADWVVLSACNTASGDGAGAEAVSGLGQAFFYAGTRALLASNWPVETTSAKALTTDIFRRQAADPNLPRAEALRLATVDLMENGSFVDPETKTPLFSFAHPLFWAPFSLVGDGQ